MTRTSTGALTGCGLSPSCSRTAVKSDGPDSPTVELPNEFAAFVERPIQMNIEAPCQLCSVDNDPLCRVRKKCGAKERELHGIANNASRTVPQHQAQLIEIRLEIVGFTIDAISLCITPTRPAGNSGSNP
jgi:hypothetical protein